MKNKVFISYKNTINGVPTKDSKMAEELYGELIRSGISTFFADKTLLNLGTDQYKDQIDAELDDCIILVVVGTSVENLLSRWVKYEWDGFQMDILNGCKKGKVFTYVDDINPHTLPRALRGVQCFDKKKEPLHKIVEFIKNAIISIESEEDDSNRSPISLKEHGNEKIGGSFSMDAIDLDYDEGTAFLEGQLYNEAIQAFLRSAKKGNPKAADKLVEIVSNNCRKPHFLNDAIWDQVREIADSGEGYANLLMHFKYYAIGENNEKSIQYLMQAVKKYDSPVTYLQLGISYGWGLGLPQNDVLAKKYYEIALAKGSPKACRYLGQMYLYGGNYVEKNLTKAEEYLRRGVDEGEENCFSVLFRLYSTMGTHEKAREIAQRMIDQHIPGGYTTMGDYYVYCDQNQKLAEEWYKEAGKHEEKGVWSKLAALCWPNNKEDAIRYAQKGCTVNDSNSYKVMGYICKENGDYEESWNYYNQAVRMYGTGYDGLAKLYLDKNYHPDNYSLADLKRDLELSVKLQDVDTVMYLLKVMLMEKGMDCATVNYEDVKDSPDTYDVLRMGANSGSKECLYMYGRLLMESTGELYNPFRGIDLVESSVEKGHTDAIVYALKHYEGKSQKTIELSTKVVNGKSYAGKNTSFIAECFLKESQPTMTFVDWLYRSMRILVWEDTYTFFDCLKIFRHALDVLQDEAKDWIGEKLEEYYEDEPLFVPFYACLLGQKISIDKEDSMALTVARNDIDVENNVLHVSKIPYFKGNEHLIWPDYSAEDVLMGDFSNERDLRILYGLTDNSLPDSLEISSESGASEINHYISDIMYPNGLNTTKTAGFFTAYTELVESYSNLVQKGLAEDLHEPLYVRYPYVSCSIEDTLEYSLQAFTMLIASREAFGSKWNEIVKNLSNVDQFPEIAETINEDDLKNLLNRYHRLILARNELILFDIHLEHASLKEVADTINAIIAELDEKNIPHDFEPVSEETLPEDVIEWRSAMCEYIETIKEYIINCYD